jgi:hypothetical protein
MKSSGRALGLPNFRGPHNHGGCNSWQHCAHLQERRLANPKFTRLRLGFTLQAPPSDTNYMKTSALLTLALAFTSCTSSSRFPSSMGADEASVELASHLEGGTLRLNAHAAGGEASALSFVELQFHDCLAKPFAELQAPVVECTAELNSDSVHEITLVQVIGNKRRFSAQASVEKSGNFSLKLRIDLEWLNKQWTGNGDITGWLGQSGNAHLHESLTF